MDADTYFLREFAAMRWPRERWHHREHVRLAYLLRIRGCFDDAADALRSAIVSYNEANGVPQTPAEGYHETVTMFWLRLVHGAIGEFGRAASSEAFCDAHPELLEKKTIGLYYSTGLLLNERARCEFVEPDLMPLPQVRMD